METENVSKSFMNYIRKRACGTKYSTLSVMNKYNCGYLDARQAIQEAVNAGYLSFSGGMEYVRTFREPAYKRTPFTAFTVNDADKEKETPSSPYAASKKAVMAHLLNEGFATVPDMMARFNLTYVTMCRILSDLESGKIAEHVKGMTWKASTQLYLEGMGLIREDRPEETQETSHSGEAGDDSRPGAEDSSNEAEEDERSKAIRVAKEDITEFVSELGEISAQLDNVSSCLRNADYNLPEHASLNDDIKEDLDKLCGVLSAAYYASDSLYQLLSSIPNGTGLMHATTRKSMLMRKEASVLKDIVHRYIDNPEHSAKPSAGMLGDLIRLGASLSEAAYQIACNVAK